MRPRQDGRRFADDIFTCIFFNGDCCILIKFSLKYVRKGSIDNNPELVQIMAWRWSGDKPLSEPMMISLPTHICVTRPQCDAPWIEYAGNAETEILTKFSSLQHITWCNTNQFHNLAIYDEIVISLELHTPGWHNRIRSHAALLHAFTKSML